MNQLTKEQEQAVIDYHETLKNEALEEFWQETWHRERIKPQPKSLSESYINFMNTN